MFKIIKKLMKKTTKKAVKTVKLPKAEPINLNEEIYLSLSKRQRRRQRKTLGM